MLIEDDRHYEEILQRSLEKDCILDRYEGFIKLKLEQYPDTSAAQMHDWLKEHYPELWKQKNLCKAAGKLFYPTMKNQINN